MADLTAFSSSSFETTQWINTTLRDRPEEEPLESYLASIAMKLHIISQDYTDQLETGMVESMTTMPRVLSDVSRIEEVLRNLEAEMNSLAAQLKSFDLRNVAGVEDLSRLDILKSNMEKCKATLEEHARWNQVVRETKNILEGGGRLADSADRIETMHRSLTILQNLPSHDERKETFESLSEALLAALRPRVRRDIVSLDLSPLHEYLYVYEKLNRKHELEEEYVRARPERLKGVWDKFNADASTAQFAPWLAMFLGKVVILLTEESGHAESLFGRERSPDVLCMLLQHSMEPLGEPMTGKLSSAESPLIVAELYTLTDDFARRIVPFLDGCSAANIYSALGVVFGGFLNFLDSYGESEGSFLKSSLTASLDGISFESGSAVAGAGAGGGPGAGAGAGARGTDDEEDYLGVGETGAAGGGSQDPLEAFESFGDRLLAAADASHGPTQAAIRRVVTVMGGLKAKPAFRAVAAALASFAKALTAKVDHLRVAAGFPSAEGGPSASVEDGSGAGAGGTVAAQLAESWARRLEESDVRGRELVPGALRALQAVGRLTRKLRELESIAAESLGDLATTIFKDVAIDRAVALITSHHQLQQAAGSSAPPSAGIASMGVGSIFANCILQSDLSAASELRSFLNASASHHASQTVFAAVNAPLVRLRATAGALLFDLCTAAPEKMLTDLHTEDVWAQGGLEYAKGRVSEEMDPALVDRLLPLPAITQVGEHLLSLVQELETFASSDALPDLLCMTGDAQTGELAARGWRRIKPLLEEKEAPSAGSAAREAEYEGTDQLCRRSSCGGAVIAAEKALFGMQLSRVVEEPVAAGGEGSAEEEADAEAAALGFVNEWLGAVADSTVGLVVAQWLQVPSLSPSGRAQLVVDLEYISNVVHAMGLRQHPLLVHLRQFLLKDPHSLMVAMEGQPARTPVSVTLHKVEGKILYALGVGHGLVQR